MLNVGAIGNGNTGNQIAALLNAQLNVPVIAFNSSQKDLDTLPNNIPKFLISQEGELSQGAGKNRSLAKKYLKDSVQKILTDKVIADFAVSLDVCFIIASIGGGTGSGITPVMLQMMTQTFPDTLFILVGVGPVQSEALSAHVNSLEFLQELYGSIKDPHYMLYDNDNFSDMPTYQIMRHVNEEVVADINVIRGYYNSPTPYDSIDTEDAMRLLSVPGRIVVARVENVKEKDLDKASLEDRLVSALKDSAHMELQRDKKVYATGLISNLNEDFIRTFNTNIPEVHKFIGEPVHSFPHTSINADKKAANSVFLIMTGVSPVNDKITKISERIEEIEEAQRIKDEESALDTAKLSNVINKISTTDGRQKRPNEDGATSVDLQSIFDAFGM